MKNKIYNVLSSIMVVGLIFYQTSAIAAITVVKSVTIGTVEATLSGITQDLTVAVKNVSDNQPANGGRVSFPAGTAVVSSTQYLEVAFASNTLGSAVRISTNNRGTGANPAFKSGLDGVLGTPDDETFEPEKGVSGGGLVGTAAQGHGFVVPILWVVYDAIQQGGYSFTGKFDKEGVVTDKAQTHAFDAQGNLIAQTFDSAENTAYASVATGMSQAANGDINAQIPSLPVDSDPNDPADNGLRSATSPVVVYLGANYTGAPAQGYATNTLTLELINQ